MKRILNFLPLFLLSGICSAQLVNDGGNITIKPGAVLYVESDFVNNTVGPSTGTVTIEGTLEVQGDLTNNATMTTAAGSVIIFSGDENSDFTSGGTVVENLKMEKDDATNGTVTLVDDLSVKTNLDFTASTNGNKLVLGAQDLLLTDQTTTITNPSANDYIVADAMGMVQKETNADGSFYFPVGDAADFSPVDVAYTSGTSTYTSANLRVNVDDVKHPNVPADADDFIERYWNVNETGIGDYSATLTGTYPASDVMGGSAGDVMGASQADGAVGMDVADWTFDGSDNAASTIVADVTTSSTDFTGFNFFGKADLKVFLHGANPSGGITMTTNINSSIPLTSPYISDPVTASSIPSDIVDWVLVGVRSASDSTIVLAQKSAFLKSNGEIVDIDGSSLPIIKDSDPLSFITIEHRNHLGVMSSSKINMSEATPTQYDFTTSLANAFGSNPMLDIGGTSVLWSGDGNADGTVNAVDKNSIWRVQNGGTYNYNTSTADFNLDGAVNAVDKNSFWRISNSNTSKIPN